MRRLVIRIALFVPLLAAGTAVAGGSVPVGQYLYASPANLASFPGSLTVRFTDPGPRMVIAYGRKNRKDRKDREGTTEAERDVFKPVAAEMRDEGKTAVFANLPTDIYDLVVIDAKNMTVHEGVRLLRTPAGPDNPEHLDEVRKSLGLRDDRIGGWEGFFDNKQFERMEADGVQGAVFLQQMRLGTAFAESGDVLKGTIHSIDVCWIERAKVDGVGWQVINRQQLFRDELPAKTFFSHRFVKALQGVRIGARAKELGPVELD